MTNPEPRLFTSWSTYWASEWLKSGNMNFNSRQGVSGLAKVVDGELFLLAVHATHPGTGQFRNFLLTAQCLFPTISIWVVEEPWFQQTLLRYGFGPCSTWTDRIISKGGTKIGVSPDKIRVFGYRWVRLPP